MLSAEFSCTRMVKTPLGEIREYELDAVKEVFQRIPEYKSAGMGMKEKDAAGYIINDVSSCMVLDDFDLAILSIAYKKNVAARKTVALSYQNQARQWGMNVLPWWPKGTYVFYTTNCAQDDIVQPLMAVYITKRKRFDFEENYLVGEDMLKAVKYIGMQDGNAIEEFSYGDGFNQMTGYAISSSKQKTFIAMTQIHIVIMRYNTSAITEVGMPIPALAVASKFEGDQAEAVKKIGTPCAQFKGSAYDKCVKELSDRAAAAFRQKQADEKWLRELGMPKGPAGEFCTTSYGHRDGVTTSTTTCRR